MKTSELTGPALDWAVAKCEGLDYWYPDMGPSRPEYSTDWSQGGPISEREGISTIRCDNDYGVDEKGFCNNIPIPVWAATTGHHTIHMKRDGPEVYLDALYYGPTALVAAMRAFVASKLGDEVNVPEELK